MIAKHTALQADQWDLHTLTRTIFYRIFLTGSVCLIYGFYDLNKHTTTINDVGDVDTHVLADTMLSPKTPKDQCKSSSDGFVLLITCHHGIT